MLIFGRLIAYALCLSARFLSATVLPGNSEAIFVALAVPKLVLGSLFSTDILALVFFRHAWQWIGEFNYLRDWAMDTKIRSQKLPHFMGNKSATALWGDCFTFELATCHWRFILCHSWLVKIKFCSE